MTRFTPECLARTDFPRLVRNNPTLAREHLEALIADPEALELYGEVLSSRGLAARRHIDHLGWEELRRCILQEGLGESTLNDETLARLAQDFDALIELQFDLFSIEDPRDSWQRALASETVGTGCLEVCCEVQRDDPVDDREVLAGPVEDYLKPRNMVLRCKGRVILRHPPYCALFLIEYHPLSWSVALIPFSGSSVLTLLLSSS